MKNSEIKKYAIRLLTSNWGQAVAVVLILGVLHVAFVLAEESVLSFLLLKDVFVPADLKLTALNPYVLLIKAARCTASYLAVTPAYMGGIWWFLRYVRGESNSIRSLFVCYSDGRIYLKTLAVKAVVFFIRSAVLLPLCGIFVLLYRLIRYTMLTGANNAQLVMLIFCLAVFSVCAVCFYVLFMLRYTMVDYIFVLNPDMGIWEIIRLSTQKMKGCQARIIRLILSFAWWVPSFILVFPIFFVVPYYAMSFTVLINDILEEDFPLRRTALERNALPAK